jgi:hypothetical protein
MMNKVILDQNLNAGLKKVPKETRQQNLNRHAEGLNIITAGTHSSGIYMSSIEGLRHADENTDRHYKKKGTSIFYQSSCNNSTW